MLNLAVTELGRKNEDFQSKFHRINENHNLKDIKKNERIIEALVSVTSFYKQHFVAEEKFNEYFYVSVLIITDKMTKDGAKLYSKWMRLAEAQTAKMINAFMAMLFHYFEIGNYKAKAMKVFNDYFAMVNKYPSESDVFEMNMALIGLKIFSIEK
jgi:hypothetical protein